jgi:spore coat protein U-like protein
MRGWQDRGTTWRALVLALVLLLSALWSGAVQAGPFSCAIASVSGISLSYNPNASNALVGSGTVTVNCSKTGGNTATRYLEIGAGTGLNATGGQNRAANGSSRLTYALRRDAALTTAWGDTTGSRLAATTTSVNSTTVTLNWWFTAAAGQTVATGTYLDTVTLRLYQSDTPNPSLTDPSPTTATLSIALTVTGQCSLSSPPGAVQFSYTSFQTTPATATSGFAVTCTNGTPYTVALDATSGTLLGLSYQLALSATGTRVGNGVAQPMSITGTMPAGQSGVCAAATCNASQARTLTVSY